MRFFLSLGFFSVLLAGCSPIGVHRCESSSQCSEDAVCAEGFCVYDPLPRVHLQASQDRARVGDVVVFDARESFLPGHGQLETSLILEPEDCAELLPSDEAGVFPVRIVRPKVDLLATLVGRSPTGREVRSTLRVQRENSPPTLALETLDEAFQPGQEVTFVATVEDPDGDEVTLDWSLEEGPGELVVGDGAASLLLSGEDGSRYRLRVDADDGSLGGRSFAELSFEGKNLPPRIVSLTLPPIEHQCAGNACQAGGRLDAEVADVGPVTYEWFARGGGDGEGQMNIDAHTSKTPWLIVYSHLAGRIAGTYRVELQARDGFGAISVVSGEIQVTNRPPVLLAHDGSLLPASPLGNDTYRWERKAGTVRTWSDPDGNSPDPTSIRWSSPHSTVEFSDPHVIDPVVRVVGEARLVDESIEILVTARDTNGAEASHKSYLRLEAPSK